MDKKKIVIGTRESTLAVSQAMTLFRYLKEKLPEAEISLLKLKTTGDRILNRTLDTVGGKGLFVKELDEALRDGRADLAVHSLKDVPAEVPEDIPILGFSRRADPRDALVLPDIPGAGNAAGYAPEDFPLPEVRKILPAGLPVGTASRRRSLQLAALFPGLEIRPVRGNVETRLRQLDEGKYGALVLAAAGLKRMGMEDRISRYFSAAEMIPSAGQGILAVQGRREDREYYEALLKDYSDSASSSAGLCERAFTAALGGGCLSPACAFAELSEGRIRLRGLYYDEKSGLYRTGEAEGSAADPALLGREFALRLKNNLQRGGQPLSPRPGQGRERKRGI